LNSQVLRAVDVDSDLLCVVRICVLKNHYAALAREHHAVGHGVRELLRFLLSALFNELVISHRTAFPCHRHAVAGAAESVVTTHNEQRVATRRNLEEVVIVLADPVLARKLNAKLFI